MKEIGNALRRSTLAASIAVLLVFLAAWEWLPGIFRVPEFILPPPTRVWSEFLRLAENEELLRHVGITTAEVVVGFILGSLLGAGIGYVLGAAPRAEKVLSPPILALRTA